MVRLKPLKMLRYKNERTTTLEGDLETMDFSIIITDFLDTNEQIEMR